MGRIWCIDGDGAALMHMGAMAVISDIKPKNMIHMVINSGAHETVGGQPTALQGRNLKQFAEALGYEKCYFADDKDELEKILTEYKNAFEDGPIFLEVSAAIGARADLGRPTTTPKENKEAFMGMLGGTHRHKTLEERIAAYGGNAERGKTSFHDKD